LLYWYKSTNTDAAGASELYSRDVSLASLTFEYTFQTTGDVRPGAYAGVARRFLLLNFLVLLVVKTCKSATRRTHWCRSQVFTTQCSCCTGSKNLQSATSRLRWCRPQVFTTQFTCFTGTKLQVLTLVGVRCQTQLDAHPLVQQADVCLCMLTYATRRMLTYAKLSSTLIYLYNITFLFFTCTVLVNLLIALMGNTFSRHQQRGRQVNPKLTCFYWCKSTNSDDDAPSRCRLTYADVCGGMLTYADVYCQMWLHFASLVIMTYADVCGRMLTYADVC
jgi:hypothetical protein